MRILRMTLVGLFAVVLLWQLPISGSRKDAPEGNYITGQVLLPVESFHLTGKPIPYGQRVRLGQAVSYEVLPLELPDVSGKSPYERHLLSLSAVAEGDRPLLLALCGGEEIPGRPLDASPASGIFSPHGIVAGDTWYLIAELPGGTVGDSFSGLILSGVFREAEFTLVEKSPEGKWLLSCRDALEEVCALKEATIRLP